MLLTYALPPRLSWAMLIWLAMLNTMLMANEWPHWLCAKISFLNWG